LLVAFILGCLAIAVAQARPSVTPVFSAQTQTNLRAPDPACTCKVYDATISFRAPAGDSTFRVRIGDVVPTPRGRARVVQVYRSFVENWDDGRVTLRQLEARASANVFVSSGAPSHVRGVAMTMVRANAGVATIVVVDGTTRTLDVKKGESITTSRGAVRVADVVDGVMNGAIGWVEIDSAPQ
jgi:hypothetical protein